MVVTGFGLEGLCNFSVITRCAVYESARNSSKLCHDLERLKGDAPKVYFFDEEYIPTHHH